MADPMAGEQYGNYTLVERLNKGGEAEIWKAINLNKIPAEIVALRILKRYENADTDDVRRHFEREVQKHRSLNSLPHIILLLDSGWEHGKPFLVMPYIPGGSLGDALKKEEWPSFKDSLKYLQQTAEALGYAHEKDIIHRDVKPANLLLDEDEILLSDFGLAIDVTTPLPLTRNWGSDHYCPPEQKAGNPVPASDQYALAVTMCVLLTRKYPKEGGKEELRQRFPKIAEVFMRAWDDEPTKRFLSIKDFANELNKAALSDFADIAAQATIPAPPPVQPSPSPMQPEQPPIAPSAPLKPSRTPFSRLVIAAVAIPLLLLALFSVWIGRGAADRQFSWILPRPPIMCLHTFTVTTTQDKAPGSFREMVDQAQDGDCITFDAAIKDRVVLTSELDIKHSITIQGNGLLPQQIKPSKTIQGDNKTTPTIGNDTNSSTTISIFPNTYVTFVDLSFEGSSTFLDNSLISNQSQNLNIISCSFHGFHSHYTGSVISNVQGNVTLKDSYLMENYSQSDGGGAIFNQGGTLTLDHSTVTSNYADFSGGGIYNISGNVYLKNHSSLNSNQLGTQDANQGGGGGGIISRGGSIAISDSEITNNTASGDGGGIFLVDASAQIISSKVMFNKAPSQKGGDIAVEADLDNRQHNYLFIDQSSSSNDIWGKVDQNDPRMISSQRLSTSSGYDPTKNNPYFVGSLTPEQFGAYCHQLNNSFAEAVMSTDEQSIRCISGDNTISNSFSDLHVHVIDVCTSAYSSAPNLGSKEHILARLTSYWDPSSWQCFGNLKKKDTSITKDLAPSGNTWLDRYCDKNYGKHASLLPLSPDKQTGYQWKCTYDDGSGPQRISMSEACKEAYGDEAYGYFAVDFLVTFTNPYSWYCWVPISINPTATVTAPPVTYNLHDSTKMASGGRYSVAELGSLL